MRNIASIAVSAAFALFSGLAPIASASSDSGCRSEVPSIRSYFYIGGEYADDGKGGHIFRNQMYIEHLKPINGITQNLPIVLIHGQAQTGTVSWHPKLIAHPPEPRFHVSATNH
jgi:hypothetical protein